jgi:hypothetical protein
MTKTKSKGPVLHEWDDEWLKTRGSYYTTITPELASRLLERNVNNRPPKQRSITQFARDMLADNWDPDASDIKFDWDQNLEDGQNRLLACMISGASFPTLVRTGLDPKSKRHVDTGVKRTVADMLKMEQIKGRPTTVGAAVTLWVRYADRVINFGGRRLANVSGGGRHGQQLILTHDEILDFITKHPFLESMSNLAEAVRQQAMPAIPASSILTFLAMAAEKDEKAALEFADRLIKGDVSGPGDPLIALIQYAARVGGGRRVTGSPGHRGRVAQESHLQAMSRVWNATRAGEKIEGRLHIKIVDRLVMPH